MSQSYRLLLASLPLCLAAEAALADTPAAPPPAITPYADLRYRLEVVDQTGLPEDAVASTLRLRAGIRLGEWQGLSAVVEGEAIAPIGATSYNDTVNGKTSYPIVADPTDVLLNQAYLRWRPSKAIELTGGRQAVNFDNQRWIGSVNWRQNDQTFDAARVSLKPVNGFSVDYLYAWRVNRVFGPDSAQGIWRDTNIHALRGSYTIKNVGTLSGYGLWLDAPSSPASSSQTWGVRIAGEHPLGTQAKALYAAEYARQQDYGSNPQNFDLSYVLFEPGLGFGPFTLRTGYERLEGNGISALQTPLATLHAFNGWADKFLTTPARGLRDLYVDAGYKLGKGPLKGLGLRAVWHDYNSTVGGLDYGSEWDAQVSYPIGKHVNLTAKAARYNADAFATDTTKLWFQIDYKY